MAKVGDLALVKLAGNILKGAKDKFEKFMEHKEPQTYEEYKKSWEEKEKKKNPITPTSTKVEKEDKKPKIEKKQEQQEQKDSIVKKEVIKKTPKKSTSTKTDIDTKNKTDKETTSVKKTTTTKEQTSSKKEAKIKLYTKDVKKHYGSVDTNFLEIIVKNLGPSIYRKDAELVSCSDPKELDTVRKNFCIKKLGFDKSESEMLDTEIKKVCERMKPSKIKYRATFYYILAKNLKKESVLN